MIVFVIGIGVPLTLIGYAHWKCGMILFNWSFGGKGEKDTDSHHIDPVSAGDNE